MLFESTGRSNVCLQWLGLGYYLAYPARCHGWIEKYRRVWVRFLQIEFIQDSAPNLLSVTGDLSIRAYLGVIC